MDVKRPHYIELPIRARRWGFRYWKTQAFEFNMAAWFAVYEKFDWDMSVIKTLPKEELSALMVYEAARQGNFVNGMPFKTPMGIFLSWVGNMRLDDGDKLKAVFLNSAHTVTDQMVKMSDDGSKKK